MLKKIFFTIISLSAILLTPILSVSALENTTINFDIQVMQSLYNTINTYQYNGSTLGPSFCQSGVAIIWNNTDSTYYAYCNYWGYFSSQVNSNNVLFPLDKTSNYLGLTNLWQIDNLSYTTKKSPRLVLKYDLHDGWITHCVNTTCTPSLGYEFIFSTGDYVYAFLDFYPNNNKPKDWVYNRTANDNVVLVGYNNLFYYSVLNEWSESNYTYLSYPDLVLGSHNSFDSEELTSTTNFTGTYSNYNNYVYTIDSVDDTYALLGVTFGYNYYTDDNYKLGFVLTYKKATDIPPLVYAKTNIGTYSCNTSLSVKSKNDTTYQWYVECPSVAFSNDENEGYLYILVQGAYDFDYTTGPVPIYDLNSLFYTNAGIVGISPIVKSVTSEIPTPIGPPEPTPDIDIIDSIDNINNTITDETAPDTSVLSNSAGWLPPGPVDSIINMPLSLFNGLLNIFSSNATCQPINVPIPYLDNKYLQLPCFNTLISSMGLSVWFEGIGAIAAAYILYHYLINLYAWVDKTLTFRENNWQDWGGI